MLFSGSNALQKLMWERFGAEVANERNLPVAKRRLRYEPDANLWLKIFELSKSSVCFHLKMDILRLFTPSVIGTHASTLALKIPWTEEPGRLQSMRSWRVGHDWVTSLSLFTFSHWRRKWQPTPVFLPRESQGQGSLVGCRLWGLRESDMTEAT